MRLFFVGGVISVTVDHYVGAVESDPGYGQLAAVLWRRRFLLLLIFLGVLSAAALYTFTRKPIYQSSMQLLVEPNYQGKRDTSAENQFADSNIEIDNSTQLAQMRSSQLLQRAVTLLQAEYPRLTAEEVQNSLVLVQLEEAKVKTKIFQAVYTSDDPVKTQKVLQAIQQVYQDYNREQQKLRLTRGLSFVNEQLPVLEDQVEQAERSLEQFRRSENVVDPDAQSRAIVDSLTSIQRERQLNQAEIRQAQARFLELRQRVNQSPQQALVATRLSQSSRFQSLLNEIQKTELSLVQQRVRFRDRSPFVQEVLDQRQRQLALLSSEVGRILGNRATGAAISGDLLNQGQLGETDIRLVNEMVEAQVNLVSLNARSQSLAASEQALTAELRRFPGLLAEYNRLQPQVQLRRDTLQQLLKARQEIALEIARGGFDWQVVEQPKLGEQRGPNLSRNLMLGAIAGLMLGSLAAFVRDGMDDSIRDPDELKKHTSLPLLGTISSLTGPDSSSVLSRLKGKPLTPSMMQVIYWSPFREAVDLVYRNIQVMPTADGLRSLVVTSSLAGEGKSTLALGLAISAARLHKRVLLIDADLRRPTLHQQLGLSNEQGLSTLLTDDTPLPGWGEIPLSYRYRDLPISLLTAGPVPLDPAKLLSSQRMAELIAVFERSYDLVVLDAPPVLGIVDALLEASFCDGVVFVSRLGQVTRRELTQATAILTRLNLLGIVANGANPAISPYFAYERKLQSTVP
jgi:capsular exopolysaccharide synthesis family protein